MNRYAKNMTAVLAGALMVAVAPLAPAAQVIKTGKEQLSKSSKDQLVRKEIVTPLKKKLNIVPATAENLPKILSMINGLRYHSGEALDKMRDVVEQIVNKSMFTLTINPEATAANDLPKEFLSMSSIAGFEKWGGGVPVVVFKYKNQFVPISLEDVN